MRADVVITRQDREGNLIESATLTPEEAVAAIRVVLERVERPAAARPSAAETDSEL